MKKTKGLRIMISLALVLLMATPMTAFASTPYWCDEGGTHHIITKGIGWYDTYKEAEAAAEQKCDCYYTHYEVQDCDCGKFTAYVRSTGDTICVDGDKYQWVKENGKWYYYYPKNTYLKYKQKLNGDYYYFNASGVMQTGWIKISGDWYYADTSTGAFYTYCTKTINAMSYTFDGDGKMTKAVATSSHAHTWDAGKVTKAATCSATGVKTYSCTTLGCTGTKTASIPKTAHSYKTTVESPDNAVHICTACGDEQKCNSSETGSYNEHTVSKATLKNNGIITDSTYCRYCNLKLSEKNKTINKIKTVSLGKNTYNYNGKTKTPSVAVKDSKGNKLIKNTDYTVSYPNGRKAVGTYAVKITFKGNYKGSKSLKFKVLPKGTKLYLLLKQKSSL